MSDTPNESHNEPGSPVGPSRRAFLTGAGAAAVAGLAAACAADESGVDESGDSAADESAAAADEATTAQVVAPPAAPATEIDFAADRQLGVLVDKAAAGLVAAFDVTVGSRDELAAVMQAVSAEVARLMAGEPNVQEDEFVPPIDSGAIGPDSTTVGVAITIGVGASLFDGRFGLADRRPSELIQMPAFFNDRLVRQELSHGDLSVQISGPNQQAVAFALHQIVRVADRQLRLRWVQEGYNQLLPDRPKNLSQVRNLMGFRDGTANPDASNPAAMDEHVWIQSDDNEPAWAVGGTYQAVRIIRMLIEFWATAALVRQEQIFGRHRDTGAPLGQNDEGEEPVYTANPDDDVIPRRAHIRLANPRTGEGLILRRGFNYLNGAAADGTMDQGLLFMCFQRSLTSGFLSVQTRLDGEPLEDYIKPIGGGLFFILPGPGTESSGWIGQSLLS